MLYTATDTLVLLDSGPAASDGGAAFEWGCGSVKNKDWPDAVEQQPAMQKNF